MWTVSRSAFGISPSSNFSSFPTSIILKPLDTISIRKKSANIMRTMPMKTYYLDGFQSRRITKQACCCAETASSYERVFFCIEIF